MGADRAASSRASDLGVEAQDRADATVRLLDDARLDAAIEAAHRTHAAARQKSARLDAAARLVMPGGNTRSVLDFAPFPFRVASADGPDLVDVDGHRYVDFCGNYTAGLLGHSPASVRAAIEQVLDDGFGIGATHPREIELAGLVCERFPCIDRVRFTNSGTEANLMAIGTALHVTGRDGVGVFDGAYHGGVLSFDHGPGLLNVPHRFVISRFDDLDGLDALFADTGLGCVIVEAVQGAGGCRPASPAFLDELQRRCRQAGTLLILDEVMTSRLSPGGAQERFGLDPDLTTLGKYLGGGMTFGAFGGKADIMAAFDPSVGGALTQAGTFNNNIVSLAAAIATLRSELDATALEATNTRGDRLRDELGAAFLGGSVPLSTTGLGSMVCVHADDDRWQDLYFHAMLRSGHYVARRGFIGLSLQISGEHSDALVGATERWTEDLRHRWQG